MAVGHRPAGEEEDRFTENSPARPLMPRRVLVAAVAAQSGAWRR